MEASEFTPSNSYKQNDDVWVLGVNIPEYGIFGDTPAVIITNVNSTCTLKFSPREIIYLSRFILSRTPVYLIMFTLPTKENGFYKKLTLIVPETKLKPRSKEYDGNEIVSWNSLKDIFLPTSFNNK